MIGTEYVAVIGLEVHAQLRTARKIYSPEAATFGQSPNTAVSAVTLAHPGTLPVLNKTAIEFAIRMGLACGSEISRYNIFDRKNYFYPDLPKGYQLTQDRTPICRGGSLSVKTTDDSVTVTLNRIHVEEDAGKSVHDAGSDRTLVDLNRAGVPLIEIVTEPCLHSSEAAAAFLSEVRKIVRYLGICDGNMEEGSLRCDANVSVMKKGSTTLGKKVEIKNMNSMRNVQRAIDHEIERQTSLLTSGGSVISETRTYDAASGKTFAMRTKEALNDYRYFPDPDLSPMVVSEEWIESIRSKMPALPHELEKKFVQEFKLPPYDAQVLTESPDIARYFQRLCAITPHHKAASNWMMGPVKSYLNEQNIDADRFPLDATALARIIELVEEGSVSFTMASQRLFPGLVDNPSADALQMAQQLNILQDSDAASLLPIVEAVIREFPLKVEEYKNGKKGIVSMFMGEVMKRSKGKADPRLASELINKKLAEV